MKKEVNKLLGRLFLVFIFSLKTILAHGEEAPSQKIRDLSSLSLDILLITALLIFIIAILSIIFSKKISEIQKKTAFYILAIASIGATLFLVGTTLYLNITSPTKGPVHWHADFVIEVCGKNLEIKDPKGILNLIGTSSVHEHNDMRIHIEGTPASLEEIELGEFFKAIKGYFDETTLSIPTNEGITIAKESDLCTNLPGKLFLFVESQSGKERIWHLEPLMQEYVISPYSNVPPGDRLKIIFTEKNPDMILQELQEGNLK